MRAVFSQEVIDEAVEKARALDFPVGKTPLVVDDGETVQLLAWDGRVIFETTTAGWKTMMAGGGRPSPEEAARFNAALARDFYRHGLHGGFWWPA